MKNNKWIVYTLVILFSLVALGAVGMAGFRIGFMRGASFAKLADGTTAQPPFFAHMQGFDGSFNKMDRGFPTHGFNDPHGFNCPYGFNRVGHGGFFPPLFGLFHLVVLGLLLWIGYKLIKNSGWRFVRVNEEAEVEAKAAKKKK